MCDDGCVKVTHQNKTAHPVSPPGKRMEEQTTQDNVSHVAQCTALGLSDATNVDNVRICLGLHSTVLGKT